MSGHSKWASIKHKKGTNDAKRGKLFTKIIKEIVVAVRMGGSDPDSNPQLRTALLKAKNANMPKDNIERAIKKGTGEQDGVEYHEMVYEAYGPGGVALLIDVLTDNRNRTAAEIRNILSKGGGNLGESGCVSYLFKRKGIISFDPSKYREDDILAVALDSSAEDIVVEDGTIEVVTQPEDFETVLKALEEANFENNYAEITMVANNTITLDREKAQKVLNLIDKLEDNDEVQNVASNLDIPQELVDDA
jgi:YebC/PmpR family DNA-binding regulatory protein